MRYATSRNVAGAFLSKERWKFNVRVDGACLPTLINDDTALLINKRVTAKERLRLDSELPLQDVSRTGENFRHHTRSCAKHDSIKRLKIKGANEGKMQICKLLMCKY